METCLVDDVFTGVSGQWLLLANHYRPIMFNNHVSLYEYDPRSPFVENPIDKRGGGSHRKLAQVSIEFGQPPRH